MDEVSVVPMKSSGGIGRRGERKWATSIGAMALLREVSTGLCERARWWGRNSMMSRTRAVWAGSLRLTLSFLQQPNCAH